MRLPVPCPRACHSNLTVSGLALDMTRVFPMQSAFLITKMYSSEESQFTLRQPLPFLPTILNALGSARKGVITRRLACSKRLSIHMATCCLANVVTRPNCCPTTHEAPRSSVLPLHISWHVARGRTLITGLRLATTAVARSRSNHASMATS